MLHGGRSGTARASPTTGRARALSTPMLLSPSLLLLLLLPHAVLSLGSRHVASVRGGGTDKETVGGGGDSGGGGGSGAGLAELRRVMVGSKEVDDPADLISFPLEAIPRQPRTDGKVDFFGGRTTYL